MEFLFIFAYEYYQRLFSESLVYAKITWAVTQTQDLQMACRHTALDWKSPLAIGAALKRDRCHHHSPCVHGCFVEFGRVGGAVTLDFATGEVSPAP